jgi:hypothetical protein
MFESAGGDFGLWLSNLFGSGGGNNLPTPLWNLNNPVGTDTLNAQTLAPAGQTWGSGGSDLSGKLKGIGDTLKGGGGGAGITQLPTGQPQSLPSGAPVHQGQGDLTSLLQLLQQRRNTLLNLGLPASRAGGGLLGM